MSYESMIHIVNRIETPSPFGKTCVIPDEYAAFSLGRVFFDESCSDLFTQEIDYKLFAVDGDGCETEYDTDAYGEKLRWCSPAAMLDWLKTQSDLLALNTRIAPFVAYLELLAAQQIDTLQVVHEGY